MMKALGIALAVLASPASAQELVYDFAATAACLSAAGDHTAKEACIGTAATACMEDSEGGGSTYGMGACLNAEAASWDGWLNDLYGALLQRYRKEDAEAQAEGWSAPSMAQALQDMQRAWIPYRDASCSFEAAQWGGGTGAGPAYVDCVMLATGEQVLFLQAMAEMH